MKFAGQFERSLDDKGRVVLPSRLRDGLPSEHVLITDMGDRLSIWPEDAFDAFVEKLTADLQGRAEAGDIDDADINDALDYLWASAQPVKPDSQGRIVIPEELLTDELRGADVIMAGNKDHIDVFPASRFKARRAEVRPKVADAIAMRKR